MLELDAYAITDAIQSKISNHQTPAISESDEYSFWSEGSTLHTSSSKRTNSNESPSLTVDDGSIQEIAGVFIREKPQVFRMWLQSHASVALMGHFGPCKAASRENGKEEEGEV